MAQHRTKTTQFIDGEPDGLRLCNCVDRSSRPFACLATTSLVPGSSTYPRAGFYYLLKVDGLEVRRLYVGQTTQGVNCLNDRNQKKPWWDRAVLFLSDDSNNFTLDTVSGLEKYAIQQAMDDCPDIVENKVAPKYKITKFQRPFIESLYGEVRFVMATMGLRVGKAPADDKPVVVPPVEPEPPAAEAASPAVSAVAVPVSMTKRKVTVQGLYDPKTDELVLLHGSPIALVTPVLKKRQSYWSQASGAP